MSRITVVPLGVCHAAWCESFYPEGMPVSWRLNYFANEFQSCCLTNQDIELLSSEGEDFADDLPEDFRCIVYLDELLLHDLGDALLKHIDVVIIAIQLSPKDLSQVRGTYGHSVKIHCLNDNRLPLCHTLQVQAQLHCQLISASQARNLNALKAEVAKWLRNDADEIVVLINSGTDIVLFRNVTTLVSLLA